MKLGLAFLIALGLGLLSAGHARAADSMSFALVDQNEKGPPQVRLNGNLEVRIYASKPVDLEKTKVQLLVDDFLLTTTAEDLGSVTDANVQELSLKLKRDDANKVAWAALLGSPFAHTRVEPKHVELVIDGVKVPYVSTPKEDEPRRAMVDFVSYDVGGLALGVVLAVIVIVVTIFLARRTSLMRDALIPQIRLEDRSYSLGRLQMAIWFCIIFSTFLFILSITTDLNSITQESFVLLGISGVTALGAVVVDQSKSSPLAEKQKTIAAMGLTNEADVNTLYSLPTVLPDGTIARARPAIKDAQVGTDINPTVQALRTAYEKEIKEIKSEGFFHDLLTDVNGPTIYRWQILAWTITLAIIYVIQVYSKLEAPPLGTNLLILMGISGGLYLGFKLPERQSETT